MLETMNPEALARLRSVLQTHVDQGLLPGAVALVARRGKVALFEHLGRQDPAAGTPMTRDSIFRIASMTKPITAVAIIDVKGKVNRKDPSQMLAVIAGAIFTNIGTWR